MRKGKERWSVKTREEKKGSENRDGGIKSGEMRGVKDEGRGMRSMKASVLLMREREKQKQRNRK